MIFDLVRDFADMLDAMPHEHPQYRILKLLAEAVHRDVHFIHRNVSDYPQALFQCLWNSCWWYDCPEAVKHYSPPVGGGPNLGAPWEQEGPKLFRVLESWLVAKSAIHPSFIWVRCLTPPSESLASMQRTIPAHNGSVLAVAVSATGNEIASGGKDGVLRLWDYPSLQATDSITPQVSRASASDDHEADTWVVSVAFSPDGNYVLFSVAHDDVHVWDRTSRREVATISPKTSGALQNGRRLIAVSPDSALVAVGIDDKVEIYSLPHGDWVSTIRGFGAFGANGLEFLPNDDRVIVVCDDDAIRVCSVLEGKCVATLQFAEDPSFVAPFSLSRPNWSVCLAVCPVGPFIAVGYRAGKLLVWNRDTGRPCGDLKGHRDRLTSVAYSSDGTMLASGSSDGTVRLWDMRSNREIACWASHSAEIAAIAFVQHSHSGQIISASLDGTVVVHDSHHALSIPIPYGHHQIILGTAFSLIGTEYVTWARDGMIRIWDADLGCPLACLDAKHGSVTAAAINDDKQLLVSGFSDGAVIVWNLRTRELLCCFTAGSLPIPGLEDLCDEKCSPSIALPPRAVSSVAISPNGVTVACGVSVNEGNSAHSAVFVWDLNKSDAPRWTGEIHGGTVTSLAFSPDGRQLCTGAAMVRVWDVASGKPIFGFHAFRHKCVRLSYSHDGRKLVIGGEAGNVIVVDPIRDVLLSELPGHVTRRSPDVLQAHICKDLRHVVTAARSQTCIWDSTLEVCIEEIEGNGDVDAIADQFGCEDLWAISRSGQTVVEGAVDGVVYGALANTFSQLKTHVSGRKWVGLANNRACLFAIEGEIPVQDPNGNPIARSGQNRQANRAQRRGGDPTAWLTRRPSMRGGYILQLLVVSMLVWACVELCIHWPWLWLLGGPLAILLAFVGFGAASVLGFLLAGMERVECPRCGLDADLWKKRDLNCGGCQLFIHVNGAEAREFKKLYVERQKSPITQSG